MYYFASNCRGSNKMHQGGGGDYQDFLKWGGRVGVCITASGNILASGNISFQTIHGAFRNGRL